MNNIKVTVDVQLQSGAKVTLTEQQRIKVEKSVEEIVFSETKTTRKKRTKVAFKAAQIKNGITPEPTKTNYIPVSSYQTA